MKKNQKMSVIRFATIQLANGDKIRAFHQSNEMCEMHSFQTCDQLVYKELAENPLALAVGMNVL